MPTHSWLFTPGTRPDRFARAIEAGANVLIVDLEDAVAECDKPAARRAALDHFKTRPATLCQALRINGLDTRAGIADLHALSAADVSLDYLVLPKTESAAHLRILDRLLTEAGNTARLIGLIETAAGLVAVEDIARATPRLAGLMFGAADMAADLGCAPSWEPLLYARGRLVAACAAACVAPIDAPFFNFADAAGLAAEIARAAEMGFAAKAAIHPAQLGVINAAFQPSLAALEMARRVLAADEKGVGVVDGGMVDRAVARRARRLLDHLRTGGDVRS